MGTEFGVEKRKDGSMRLTAHAEFSHYCEHENYYLIPAIDSVESLVTAPLTGLEDLLCGTLRAQISSMTAKGK